MIECTLFKVFKLIKYMFNVYKYIKSSMHTESEGKPLLKFQKLVV